MKKESNCMKKVILLLGYFLGLIFTLILIGYFYPLLSIDLQLSDIEKITLRFLASFSYYGDVTQFWILIGVSVGLFEILLLFTFLKTKNTINSIVINTIGVVALSNYFFWVLSRQITPTSGLVRYQLPIDFFGKTVIYISILIVLGLINILVLPKVFRSKYSDQKIAQSSPNMYECPHCHTTYHSKVLYCTHCQKSIIANLHIDQGGAPEVGQKAENSK
ncbi:MAG: hypothetical protein ACTSYI_10225 [Promethearchaeota archaeon]